MKLKRKNIEYILRYILLKFAFIFRVPLKMSFFKYFVLGGIEMRTNEWNLLNYDLWVTQNAFAFCVVGSIFEVYHTSNSIKNKLPKTRLRQLLGSTFIFCLSVCAICLLICQIYHNLLPRTISLVYGNSTLFYITQCTDNESYIAKINVCTYMQLLLKG